LTATAANQLSQPEDGFDGVQVEIIDDPNVFGEWMLSCIQQGFTLTNYDENHILLEELEVKAEHRTIKQGYTEFTLRVPSHHDRLIRFRVAQQDEGQLLPFFKESSSSTTSGKRLHLDHSETRTHDSDISDHSGDEAASTHTHDTGSTSSSPRMNVRDSQSLARNELTSSMSDEVSNHSPAQATPVITSPNPTPASIGRTRLPSSMLRDIFVNVDRYKYDEPMMARKIVALLKGSQKLRREIMFMYCALIRGARGQDKIPKLIRKIVKSRDEDVSLEIKVDKNLARGFWIDRTLEECLSTLGLQAVHLGFAKRRHMFTKYKIENGSELKYVPVVSPGRIEDLFPVVKREREATMRERAVEIVESCKKKKELGQGFLNLDSVSDEWVQKNPLWNEDHSDEVSARIRRCFPSPPTTRDEFISFFIFLCCLAIEPQGRAAGDDDGRNDFFSRCQVFRRKAEGVGASFKDFETLTMQHIGLELFVLTTIFTVLAKKIHADIDERNTHPIDMQFASRHYLAERLFGPFSAYIQRRRQDQTFYEERIIHWRQGGSRGYDEESHAHDDQDSETDSVSLEFDANVALGST
jgi:hypothetical protein